MSEEKRKRNGSPFICSIDYVKVAKELGYSEKVIEKLMKAKNDYERDRIMKSARQNEEYAPEPEKPAKKIIWNKWEE